MAESIEQLSFQLAIDELAHQERALAGLRTCAGTVLAAASIAGSLLAARTSHGSPDPLVIVAVISFAVCSGSATWVLLPHKLVFAFGGDALFAPGVHGERDITEAYRAAGTWIEPHLRANDDKIAGLSSWLTVSCVVLTAEIISWAISLTG